MQVFFRRSSVPGVFLCHRSHLNEVSELLIHLLREILRALFFIGAFRGDRHRGHAASQPSRVTAGPRDCLFVSAIPSLSDMRPWPIIALVAMLWAAETGFLGESWTLWGGLLGSDCLSADQGGIRDAEEMGVTGRRSPTDADQF